MTALQSKQPIPNRVFSSKVDRWIAVLLVLPSVVGALVGVMVLIQGDDDGMKASILFVFAAALLVLHGVLVLPCRYTFLEDALSIRCGLICYQLPYQEIRGVERSRSWASAPALSLDRIQIRSDQRTVLISPVDRDGFLEEFKRRCDVASQIAP